MTAHTTKIRAGRNLLEGSAFLTVLLEKIEPNLKEWILEFSSPEEDHPKINTSVLIFAGHVLKTKRRHQKLVHGNPSAFGYIRSTREAIVQPQ